jgi:uncharacterized caspase-like protein
MRRTIADFAKTITDKGPDTVALVFYAGHGLQVDGENFLVPVDARIEREADVPLQAVRLADLMNALSAVPSKSRIVILDACRNNPILGDQQDRRPRARDRRRPERLDRVLFDRARAPRPSTATARTAPSRPRS